MPRRTVSRRLPLLPGLVLALALLALLPAHRTAAHPLGNFTINHYSRVEFADGAARVTYVLDFAEIPTYQQLKRLDPDGDGALSDAEAAAYLAAELPALVQGLRLTVGGEVLALRVHERSAAFLPGQGGLPTLRIEARLLADLPQGWEDHGTGSYADRTYAERPGWREIVIQGGRGVAVAQATAPAVDLSNELRAYPEDALASPPDRREATFALAPGSGSAAGDTAGRAAGRVKANNRGGGATDRVAALIATERLTPIAIAIALVAALVWGAAHALSPGHGKTVVAAYLIGARGTARHAAFLGLTVTLTHTVGVFALGAVTLFLSRYILPEVLYPWLNVVSGLLVVAIGLALFYQRFVGLVGPVGRVAGRGPGQGAHPHPHADGGHAHAHHHHHSGHDHDHHHHQHDHAPAGGHAAYVHTHDGHTHSHLPPGADGSRVTWRSLLALGVSGGLVPCPSALVLLLSAISLGRLEFGMVLVVAFSTGLAIVLTGIGLLLVYARWLFERCSLTPRVPRFLPVASALAIALAGLAIVLGALRQAGAI